MDGVGIGKRREREEMERRGECVKAEDGEGDRVEGGAGERERGRKKGKRRAGGGKRAVFV